MRQNFSGDVDFFAFSLKEKSKKKMEIVVFFLWGLCQTSMFPTCGEYDSLASFIPLQLFIVVRSL